MNPGGVLRGGREGEWQGLVKAGFKTLPLARMVHRGVLERPDATMCVLVGGSGCRLSSGVEWPHLEESRHFREHLLGVGLDLGSLPLGQGTGMGFLLDLASGLR